MSHGLRAMSYSPDENPRGVSLELLEDPAGVGQVFEAYPAENVGEAAAGVQAQFLCPG